jgi:hypothetical protein
VVRWIFSMHSIHCVSLNNNLHLKSHSCCRLFRPMCVNVWSVWIPTLLASAMFKTSFWFDVQLLRGGCFESLDECVWRITNQFDNPQDWYFMAGSVTMCISIMRFLRYPCPPFKG